MCAYALALESHRCALIGPCLLIRMNKVFQIYSFYRLASGILLIPLFVVIGVTKREAHFLCWQSVAMTLT